MTDIDSEELLDLVNIWYSDGLRPLNYILGYIEYLLLQDDVLDSVDDSDVQESLEAIHHYSHIVKENWENVWHYLILSYGDISPQWQAQRLHEVTKMALVERTTSTNTLSVQVNVSQDLPPIRGNEWLVRLVTCFLFSPVDNDQPEHIIIETNQRSESKLIFQVIWQEIPTSLIRMSETRLFYPGNHLSIAKLILEKAFDEKLEVEFSGNEIRFHFSLSIWQS